MVMDEVDFTALWDKSLINHWIFQFICMKINTVLWPLSDMWQSGNVVVLFWYWQLFSFFLHQSSIAESLLCLKSCPYICFFLKGRVDLLSLLVPTFSFKLSVSLLSSWLKGEMVLDPSHPNSPHPCLSLKLCSPLPSPFLFMVSILLYNSLHSLPSLCDCPRPLGIPSLSTSPARLYLRVNQASGPCKASPIGTLFRFHLHVGPQSPRSPWKAFAQEQVTSSSWMPGENSFLVCVFSYSCCG